jgi:polysaccharide pyruvyl transferase WcaK-like protein
MIIEIRGVGFANKGSELMLAAILDRLGPKFQSARFAVLPSAGSFVQRARYGLHQKMQLSRMGRLGRLLDAVFHAGYRSHFGMVTESEIDAVLDASGFALADFQPAKRAQTTALEFERLKQNGAKIILLPQAFGPFEKAEVRHAARHAFSCADLIFARDPESHSHVRELIGDDPKLAEAPDFTGSILGSYPNGLDLGGHPAFIVPNSMMFLHGAAGSRAEYFRFLADCAAHLRGRGLDPIILTHETLRDSAFADALGKEAGLRIINGTDYDARSLKAIIGKAVLVVGSRFHALKSALSQAIPAVGTSWSHKYQYLFGDYERRHWVVEPHAGDGTVDTLVGEILENLDAEKSHLLACAARVGVHCESMWQRVEMELSN